MRDIRGSVALVTGASSGIGEAAARALSGAGVHVLMTARSADRLGKLESELEGSVAVACDVGDPEQVTRLFETIRERFDGLDLLFNNAGVGYFSKFEDSQRDEWYEQVDANLYGVLYCTQEAIPLMRGREGAMISTVSSIAGRAGMEGWSVYAATKHAVVGFHDALRRELGPEGIRVSLIEPGAVHTNWGFNVPKEKMEQRREEMEALHAEDIAEILVSAFRQPGNVNWQELLVMPTKQIYP
jgi:NADP-dependent 3-hydroxy acid dehydrogenase YdfG